jgi:hypothetical protein
MRWIKKGLLFVPDGKFGWMRTHAALPVVDPLGGNLFALYFSARDEQGRARIGRLDFDITDPKANVRVYEHPALELGPLGAFDDSGVTSACVVTLQGSKRQYFSGWTLGRTVPFYFYIGAADSTDGGLTWTKVSRGPVLGRDKCDPFLTASPFVVIESDVWRMWYVSCVRWEMATGTPKHYYHIKYAESSDGIHWSSERPVCIDFKSHDEYAIARPCVLKDEGLYRMWYSFRGNSYRIGYAESPDGITWTRRDEEAGIEISESGWDSEMLTYPWVFRHENTMYMLYNGNSYGKTGVGLAVASR